MSQPEIIVEQRGPVAIATLNRPNVLNALSHNMIKILGDYLRAWEADDTVACVILTGAGDRAFCAGGDVKAAYHARESALDYFADEYRLDRMIYHYAKPVIALLNGITMGGGFGIAGPCRYRVACPATMFAMPETGIGFFPDVGATYFLSRLPGQAGRALGVTGMTIPASDMVHLGFATLLLPHEDFESFIDRLVGAKGAVDTVLTQSDAPAETGIFAQFGKEIDGIFGCGTVEEALARLRAASADHAWAAEMGALLAHRSPFSMKLALHLIDDAAKHDFDTVIARDFQVAAHLLRGHDFYEGVRAQLIDKDKSPQWAHGSVNDVSDAAVASCLLPVVAHLDDFHSGVVKKNA